MKTPILSVLALAAVLLLPTGCTNNGALDPLASSGVSIGTSLAVSAYPAAGTFVEMFANGIRAYTAKGPITPAALGTALAPYITAAENLAAKVSTSGASDIQRYATAILAKYTAWYPKLQSGEATVESFAQAVEAGA